MLEFSLNPLIHDKPAAWEPAYASGWQRVTGELSDLRQHVEAGTAFIPAALTSDHRSSAAFAHADLAVVDIDNGLTVEQFSAHPLAASAAYVYTTASHDPPQGKHRFRIVFQLPRRVSNPDLYKAITTLLSRSLGGDKSCTDPCRLFYACSWAATPIWQPKAFLSDSILDDAEKEAIRAKLTFNRVAFDYDDNTIETAIHVLEQVLEPTADGQRDRFVKITAAASSAGDAIFPAWSDWATRGHHGTGKNSKQATEKFFRGFSGKTTLATLFFLANEEQPSWRDALPDELRQGRPALVPQHSAVGYDHESFLGLDDPFGEINIEQLYGNTPSIFDSDRPWTKVIAPPPPTPAIDDDCDDISPEEEEAAMADLDDYHPYYDEAPTSASNEHAPKIRNKRGGSPQDDSVVRKIKTLLQKQYPGLRLNIMSQELEYGPKESPQLIHDISMAYVYLSANSNELFAKNCVFDTAHVVGWENRYHPVKNYLEHCSTSVPACPYFKTLASDLLGLPDDPLINPRLEDGRLLADVALERFLIGAVARVLHPGCDHDWMPILVGSQNSGKSNFFRYITPPSLHDPGSYPWISTVQQGLSHLKEKPHVLHASWLVLLDEVERYFKRDYAEELKNLISVSVDRSAPKYQNERNFPRAFVLCGCANSNDFFVDPTGNRRFIPISVQGKIPSKENPNILTIDLDRLKADRDSIWSAAYQAYLDNPTHAFSSYELSQIKDYLDGFRYDNPIDAKLAVLLETRTSGIWDKHTYVTVADIHTWMDIPADRQLSMNRAITDSLKRMGYVMQRCRIGAGKGVPSRVMRIWLRPKPR